MIAFPNAKINLGLRILGKRPDGYHNLETIFLPVSLCDVLEIVPRSECTKPYENLAKRTGGASGLETPSGDYFVVEGAFATAPHPRNTVLRVVALLRERGSAIPPLYITLHKRIPFGAGLGGGSADATFALLILERLFSLSLTDAEKITLLASVGADCPFFLLNKPALARGTGTELSAISLPSELLSSYVTIIKPPFSIATAEAYRRVTKHPEAEGSLGVIVASDRVNWQASLLNDFEEALVADFPRIQEIKSCLYAYGAYFALLSGSGSSIFALSQYPLPRVSEEAKLGDCFVWQGRILSSAGFSQTTP